MPDVYDKEKTGRPLSASERNAFDDIERNYESTASPHEEDQKSAAARSILNQEREAAKGSVSTQTGPARSNSNIVRGGLGVPTTDAASSSDIERGGFGGGKARLEATQKALTERENSLRPSTQPAAGDQNFITRVRAKITRRRAIVGILFSIVGGGAGIAGFTVLSGPLQFIHAGQLLSGFHLDEKNGQSDARMLVIARYMKFLAAGTPERSRLGVLGNRYADKVQAKFVNSGIDTKYNSRTGYADLIRIDPERITGGQYDRLRGKSPQEIVNYLRDDLKIAATVDPDGRVIIDTNQPGYGYLKNRQVYSIAYKAAGYKAIPGSIAARFMGKRSGISWHPIAKLDRKIIQSADDRLKIWQDKRKETIRRNAGPVAPGVSRGGDTGDPIDPSDEDELRRTIGEAGEAGRDPGKLETLRNSIYAKVVGGVVGAVGILCLAQYISENIDEVNKQNVIEPSMRMGMNIVALGSQISSGVDLDGETEQLGWMADLMQDDVARNSFFDAMSINAEQGKGLVGTDIPPQARPVDENNIFTQVLGAIPALTQVCQAAGSTAGIILLTAAGVALGPFSAIFGTIVGLITIPILVDYITDKFAGTEINPLAQGAELGNIANYGVRLAANDQAISSGGLPLTAAQSADVKSIETAMNKQEFMSKKLSERLFDTYDRRSFISQVIDSQSPDPGTNISKLTVGFLGIGSTIRNTLTKPLTASVVAAPITPYDYGFDNYGFTAAEMDNPRVQNPFENANRAVDALDSASGADYVTRAQNCFGITLEKKIPSDLTPDEAPEARWGVGLPVEGSSPTYKKIKDPANNCLDQSSTWTDIRFFIFDSQIMNAAACYEGNNQACIDIGMNPAAAISNTGAPAIVGENAFPLDTTKSGVGNPDIFANGTTSPGSHGYTSYDIYAAPGTPVVAFVDGTVEQVGVDVCGGRLLGVYNQAANIMVSYLHLDAGSAVGDKTVVQKGDRLGVVGSVQNGCGTAHLHIDAITGNSRPGCSRDNCPAATKAKFVDIGPQLFQTYQALAP